MGRRNTGARLALGTLAALLAGTGTAVAAEVRIDVLSSRADLVSGGDALVAIDLPAGRTVKDVKVTLGGKDVTGTFASRRTGRVEGLLTGIPDRPTRLAVSLQNGTGASIRLVGHPNGGPLISGPQLQPWVCQPTAVDAQCNQPAGYALLVKGDRGFEGYDPENPPADVPTTVTDEGRKVPFVVRVETGYQDRDQYRIATLYDPGKPWEPWAPQEAWNRKVVITHGGSCGTDRRAGNSPDVLNEEILGKGYIVMSTALNNLGHNCNPVIVTESELMAKERIVEQYGPIKRTIGTGCSGGSIAQLMSVHAYPGLYDGVTHGCTFADLFTTGKHAAAGHLFKTFFKIVSSGEGGLYTPLDQALVSGSPAAVADDAVFDASFWPNITGATGCRGLPDAQKWSVSNTGGTRCGVLDHNINVLGKGASGYAAIPLDNVGVQFGLKPLLAGLLSPAKFADLNARIGGLDRTTFAEVPARTEAELPALTNSYRAGYMAVGNTLAQTPIIEWRGPNEATAHVTYPSLSLRARLMKQVGSTASHALWQGPVPVLGQLDFANRAVFAMDRWVDAIQKDSSSRSQEQKVRENRPKDITDHCEPVSRVEIPGTDCPAINRFYASPSQTAGESVRNDILKCQLKPLRREDYPGVTFTEAQWASLQTTFPAGVCDWEKPSVGQTDTVPWLTYARKAGGEELGAVPASAPFAGVRAVGVRAALERLRRPGATATRIVLAKADGTTRARAVTVRVTDARGRLLASSRARTLTAARTTTVLRRVRPVRGAVRVDVLAKDAAGVSAIPGRTVHLRFGR